MDVPDRFPSLRYIVCCLLGLGFNIVVFLPNLRYRPDNDFIGLYAGARLAGTPAIYNPARILAEQQLAIGSMNLHRLFIRPPFVAVLLAPLCRLPFSRAFATFELLMLACCAGFVLVWAPNNRRTTLLACCWSTPLWGSLVIGQDVPLILLVLAAAFVLLLRRWDYSAGLLFSFVLIKPHLFLLLPIWIFKNRLWRFAQGALLGGVSLVLLGFAAGGPLAWRTFLTASSADVVSPNLYLMPNLRGITGGYLEWELAGDAAVLCVVGFIIARSSAAWGFAAVLAGGILISHHAYVADCALLIPSALLVLNESQRGWQRVIAWLVLTPLPYIALFLPPLGWLTWSTQLAYLAVFTITPQVRSAIPLCLGRAKDENTTKFSPAKTNSISKYFQQL